MLDTKVQGWHGKGAVNIGRLNLAGWLNRGSTIALPVASALLWVILSRKSLEQLRSIDVRAWLGVPLLTRGRQGVTPTQAGRTLLQHARVILRQSERLP